MIEHLVPFDMNSNYSVLTPPSSSEDSPQPIMYYHSPPSASNDIILLQPGAIYQSVNEITAAQSNAPYLRVLEQPIDKFRFRYKSEMTGTHGSLCGLSSDRNRRQTFPTVELVNYDKNAVIRCSIYQVNVNEEDFKPHPHRLTKRKGKGETDDPHDLLVTPEDEFRCAFHSMGIIHTAKKYIIPEMVRKMTQLKREEIARKEGRYRELNTNEEVEIKGLAEKESKSVNLNVVCLRFDAFSNKNGILEPICPPVFSQSINNLKSALTGELKIARLDHCTSPAKGGREVFMLVERVTKKNIKVRLFEMDDEDNVVWEDYGKFSDLDVHHQYAIVFRTPPYRDQNIKNPVRVLIELERPSDKSRSDAKEFTYIPSPSSYKPGSKRARMTTSSYSYDTSMASDELPIPISELSLGCNLLDPSYAVTSEEIQQAISNVNSEEFRAVFNEFKQDYMSVTMDAPVRTNKNSNRIACPSLAPLSSEAQITISYKKECSNEDRSMADEALNQLRNFIKTQPTDEKAINMLNHYLNKEDTTNALHISIMENDRPSVLFLLKMIYVWKQNHLVNVRSEQLETPLHIAVHLHLDEIVMNLIMCKADASIVDSENNTSLHAAVINNCSMSVLESILSVDNVKYFIDYTNNDGNTPLNLAIECKNMGALKILCTKGANMNRKHDKSGFTPLRFAVEKQDLQMVQFILQHCDPLLEDFQGINPLTAAIRKDNQQLSVLITEFMALNDYCDVHIKSEIEENSDEELEEKICVKVEQISAEELKEMYTKVDNFTPECLDELAYILDESGRWQDLVELLDLGHLLRNGYLKHSNQVSPTKSLLKVAVEAHGDTVLQIRDFLESLDEVRAVQTIDEMVKAIFY